MKLTIIIIEFLCMDEVLECIASVNEYAGHLKPDCVVISNSNYSQEQLKEYRSQLVGVDVVSSPDNLGYAGGVNLGLERAESDYVYILNPDCRLMDNMLEQMLENLASYPNWALAGPKVVNQNGCVQPSSRRFPKVWTYIAARSFLSKYSFFSKEQERYFMIDFPRKKMRQVDWVSGGAMLVNTAKLDQIGKMDERYFLYMEDVDWCRNSWDNGCGVIYCPESVVMHAGKHSSIKLSFKALLSPHIRWHVISIFRYFRKWGDVSSLRLGRSADMSAYKGKTDPVVASNKCSVVLNHSIVNDRRATVSGDAKLAPEKRERRDRRHA